jgi:hypothetical protein
MFSTGESIIDQMYFGPTQQIASTTFVPFSPFSHLLACKSTGTQISLLGRKMRRYIEIEYIHRKTHGGTCVGYIDDSGNVTLHRGARQQEVDLVVVVACAER